MTPANGASRIRFEYSRHETFAIREGWIPKGLALLEERDGDFRPDLETADALGLGSKMVKSLGYWLEAVGMSETTGVRKERAIRLTPLAQMISMHDSYLEFPVSWWIMHIMLARREGSVWNWFFNDFNERVFDRTTCVEAFLKHVRDRALNPTSPTTAHRDVACLLSSYALVSGGEQPDPEDATTCPFRSLSLVVKHSDTGRFEKTRSLDLIPVEAFLACAGLVARDIGNDSITFVDLMRQRNAPARLLGLDGDAIDELATAAAALYRKHGVSISMLGTNRTLTIPRLEPSEWLSRHFARIGGAA
ncbi:hypothetical protein DK26_06850 [Bosea sp. WAO]|uniref:DUF4007 family protein n=1 Tax=Bosea sp. WAO TaxID=406341 RepID=UPI00074B191E|nr:DUF4007 family protein [Bosea sp. WAO]KUL96500.1 hypothetical protein DK26_06850 [Bosea sp. WAO]